MFYRTACCVDVVEACPDGIPECRSCGCPGPRMLKMDPEADAHLFDLTELERRELARSRGVRAARNAAAAIKSGAAYWEDRILHRQEKFDV